MSEGLEKHEIEYEVISLELQLYLQHIEMHFEPLSRNIYFRPFLMDIISAIEGKSVIIKNGKFASDASRYDDF